MWLLVHSRLTLLNGVKTGILESSYGHAVGPLGKVCVSNFLISFQVIFHRVDKTWYICHRYISSKCCIV